MVCAGSSVMTIGAQGPVCNLVLRSWLVLEPGRDFSDSSITQIISAQVLGQLGYFMELLGTIMGVTGSNCCSLSDTIGRSFFSFCLHQVIKQDDRVSELKGQGICFSLKKMRYFFSFITIATIK